MVRFIVHFLSDGLVAMLKIADILLETQKLIFFVREKISNALLKLKSC